MNDLYSNKNLFELELSFRVSIAGNYDYIIDYMENVARNFTKKYPSYLIHKKSEDKIKAFLTDTVKAKVETFCRCRSEEHNRDRSTGDSGLDSRI